MKSVKCDSQRQTTIFIRVCTLYPGTFKYATRFYNMLKSRAIDLLIYLLIII